MHPFNKRINAFGKAFSKTIQTQVNGLIKTLFALALTLSAWVLSLDAVHTQSPLNSQFSETTPVYLASKQFSNIQLLKLTLNDAHSLLVINEHGEIINRVGVYQYKSVLLIQTFSYLLIAYLLFVCCYLLIQKRLRRLVAGAVTTAVTLLLSGVLTNLSFTTPITVPLMAQLMLILCGFIAYLCCYKLINTQTSDAKTLLAFASQTGSALSVAKRFHKHMPNTFDLRCLSTLTPKCLNNYQHVFFIASTYGQGQPPEKAKRFYNQMLSSKPFSDTLNFSILALGDRTYQHFCAFGHQLSDLLRDKGATPINDVIEVDKMDNTAIAQWWNVITQTLCLEETPIKLIDQRWQQTLVLNNQQLNINNKRAAHRITLARNKFEYQAGDLLEVFPKLDRDQCLKMITHHNLNPNKQVTHLGQQKPLLEALRECDWLGEVERDEQKLIDRLTPLPARVYSIASTPTNSEEIEIFVRRFSREDGSPGVASHYLCDLANNDSVRCQIRKHVNFHLPNNTNPIIFIGAGTGIAPLIGHLKTRQIHNKPSKNWLFFGEQHKDQDFYFEQDIKAMLRQGHITKFTSAWSRDGDGYLSNQLIDCSVDIKQWVIEQNAYIYLCGKQQGFGASIINTLKQILGLDNYQTLIDSNRIRIDLY